MAKSDGRRPQTPSGKQKLSPLWIALTLAFAAVLLMFLFPGTANNNPAQNQNRVCFQQNCFTVELALTPEQQVQGLMNRQTLGNDSGMLFVFPQEGIYPFWMKDTLIPLDMIWMDSNGTVVFIGKDEQPCGMVCPSINPGVQAKYVLEVNAGTVDRIGLTIGSRMTLDIQG
jgi:uncharacterized membrane protein (UPF0127 family)